MPHFTLQLDVLHGPVVNAAVGVSGARRKALIDAGAAVPPQVAIRALIDTGASLTSIDPSALAKLGLEPTGSVSVHTPSTGATPHSAAQYDVSLLIPGPTVDSPMLRVDTMPVITAELTSQQGIDALIGRDVLHTCLLVYNGSMALFTIAY
jgi:hypothetical protein